MTEKIKILSDLTELTPEDIDLLEKELISNFPDDRVISCKFKENLHTGLPGSFLTGPLLAKEVFNVVGKNTLTSKSQWIYTLNSPAGVLTHFQVTPDIYICQSSCKSVEELIRMIYTPYHRVAMDMNGVIYMTVSFLVSLFKGTIYFPEYMSGDKIGTYLQRYELTDDKYKERELSPSRMDKEFQIKYLETPRPTPLLAGLYGEEKFKKVLRHTCIKCWTLKEVPQLLARAGYCEKCAPTPPLATVSQGAMGPKKEVEELVGPTGAVGPTGVATLMIRYYTKEVLIHLLNVFTSANIKIERITNIHFYVVCTLDELSKLSFDPMYHGEWSTVK